VVTRDIPSHALAVGVPARVVRYLDAEDKEQRTRLEMVRGETELFHAVAANWWRER